MPYSCIVRRPDPAVEYFDAYKYIGRKYTFLGGGADASAVIQAAVNALTSGGRLVIKASATAYSIKTAINFGAKSIVLEGEGWGSSNVPTTYPVTVLKATSSLTDFMIKVGSATAMTRGVTIRNIALDGADKTEPLGGISWRNIWNGLIENVFIDDFFRTTAGSEAVGIKLFGDAAYGCYYNTLIGCSIRRATIGVWFGYLANSNIMIGGDLNNSRAITSYGLYFDLTNGEEKGGDTNLILHPDVCNFSNSTSIAVYVKKAAKNEFHGLRLEFNYGNIKVEDSIYCAATRFFGGHISNIQSGGYALDDAGNRAKFFRMDGFVTEKSGTATGTGAQQTIAHGCGFTPTANEVFLSERTTGGALARQTAVPDNTNIYITATNAKDYNWKVEKA